MADTVPVTRKQLAAALVTVGEAGDLAVDKIREYRALTCAEVRYPDAVAAAIFDLLAAEWDKKLRGQPIVLLAEDQETSAIGCIVAALEGLDTEATGRVLCYVAGRYANEIALAEG